MPRGGGTEDERVPLTRDRVLEAGVTLADEHGLDALSMRRLGEAVGVEAMSLYNHVANKRDLLGGMLEHVLAEVTIPNDAGGWRPAAEALATTRFETLMAHPWAAFLLSAETGLDGPAQLGLMEAMLRILRRGGFTIEQTHHAFHVLDTYVVGTALQAANFPHDAAEVQALAGGFLADLDAQQYPYLAEHVGYHVDAGVLSEGDFAFGLGLVLEGLDRLR